MKILKDELQNIILGDGPSGEGDQLKKTQTFLRRYAETCLKSEGKQHLNSEEEKVILVFADKENLIYSGDINIDHFISEGAEQRVYRLNESQVIKTNGGIFYEYWLDYFNSLLLHNFFFPSTAYSFLGF